MDATLSLALAVKLQKLLEREDRFLSFPLGLTMPERALDFMAERSETSAAERQRYKADFARLVNLLPRDGEVVFAPDGRLLWDVVESVLDMAAFAESALTSEEERRLAEAIDFLTDEQPGPDGTVVPVSSEKVRLYTHYRLDAEQAADEYRVAAATVAAATGLEGEQLRADWYERRERELERAKAEAMQAWVDLGCKHQVEAIQALRNALEPRRYPLLYRESYLDDLDLARDTDLDANGLDFRVTYYTPCDAFNPALPWVTLPLLDSEVSTLVEQASPHLRRVFGDLQDEDAADISALSLEYCCVDVNRPWFRPEFFRSRTWRVPGDQVVSDGGNPSAGMLPAYINSLVAVRNLTVIRRTASAARPLRLSLLTRAHAIDRPSFVGHWAAAPRAPGGSGHSAFSLDLSRVRESMRRAFQDKTRLNAAVPAARVAKSPVFGPALATALRPADSRKEMQYKEGVTILAFVCQRVPKAPDPDPALRW
jgi:hypothetical protein